MKRRLATLLATLGLLFALVPVAPAAATTCSALIYFYEGANGTGGGIAFCAEDKDLPLRQPPQGASFDQGWRFNWPDNTLIDNRISSYRWDPTTYNGNTVRIFSGYYYNGSMTFLQKWGSPAYCTQTACNLNATWNNVMSSFYGCGTSCADD